MRVCVCVCVCVCCAAPERRAVRAVPKRQHVLHIPSGNRRAQRLATDATDVSDRCNRCIRQMYQTDATDVSDRCIIIHDLKVNFNLC